MSAILPGSRKTFPAAKLSGKLGLLLAAAAFCTGITLFAGAKAWHKLNVATPPGTHKSVRLKGKRLADYKPVNHTGQGGTVSIDYGGHDFTFHTGKLAGLVPASGGVDAPSPGVYGGPVVLGSGLTFSQNGVALDAAGNMYVNDQDSGTGDVKKIAADGSSTTIIGSGFLTQSGNIAVDKAGNVYVTDQATVWKIPVGSTPGTYNTPVIFNSTFSRPYGIATDAADNVYVTDLTVGGVYRMANDGTGKTRIDDGLSDLAGIAVDGAGNVFVCSYVSNILYEIPFSGGPSVQLASGFASALALAVDGMGNIYVGDKGASKIYEVPAGGGTPVAVVSDVINNVGVAVDASYSLYICIQVAGNGVNKYSPVGGFFISQPLPAGLSFDNTTGAIIGKPTTVTAEKSYIVSAYNSDGGISDTLHLAIAAPGPAPVVSYSNPNVFTLSADIISIAPSATGVGAPGYAPNVPLANNLSNTSGIAHDASGNIYVALSADNTIRKIPADGSPATNLGTGFASPAGVAVDASGNIYVADSGNGAVVKMSADGLSTSAIGSGFSKPYGVALDATGNVYVADQTLGAVFKILASDGSTVKLADGFSLLAGIAVDKTGQNIYVSDAAVNSVYKVASAGGGATILASTFAFPFSIALDPAGNLFVADFDFINSTNIIYKGDGHSADFVNTGVTFLAASGMTADASGNLFVADAGTSTVYETSPSGGYFLGDVLPKGLKLNDTTGVITGTPAIATPAADYHVVAYNANGGTPVIVNIAVNAPPPPVISYANPNVDTLGITITPIAPAPANNLNPPAYADHQAVTNGFTNPLSPASDAAGNIYVLDRTNDLVKKIPADGSSPVAVATGFAFGNLTALAVDAAGNVYVADQGNHAIEKIAPDGVTVTTVGGTFNFPVGVAVDGSNNVYVADLVDGAVYKVLASDGSTVTLSGTFDFLSGIAVDKTGQDIYVSDAHANSVYKISPTCGCPEDLGYYFTAATGVALDPQGNVYVTDADTSNSTGTLLKGDRKIFNFSPISTPFLTPKGVTVDPFGNLFITDTGTGTLEKVTPTGGYFLAVPLPKGLKLNDTTGVITGKPGTLSIATDYKITTYNFGGGTTALVNIALVAPPPPTLNYTTPNSYIAGIAITPLHATSTYVAAPDHSANFTSIGTGFNAPRGTAVDKAGNVFVADSLNNRVMMIPADGGSPTPWGYGFSGPTGVAVDSLGFVYVADYGNHLIKKVSQNGVTVTQLASADAPTAVAVDSAENVYYTDLSTQSAYKISAASGTVAPLATAIPLIEPIGIAVSGTHVYVSDSYWGAVFRITDGVFIPDAIGPFNYPAGIAVDAGGNLYVSDEGDSTIYRVSANSINPRALSTTGLSGPEGLSIDGKGTLYIADVNNNLVARVAPLGGYFIDKALPSGLSFNGKTGSIYGTPVVKSAARDYTVSAYNAGGTVSAIVNIGVGLPPPPTLSYTGPNTYMVGVAIPVLTPSLSNNFPTSYTGAPVTVSSGYNLISGVAIDKAGNVFVTDTSGVYKLQPGGTGAPQSIGSGFNLPQNVAVDAAGNVYVADSGNGAIKKIPHGTGTPVTIASGFDFPIGIAVSAAGDVYFTDSGSGGNGAVYKLAGGKGSPITVTTDLLDPESVAVDAAGNVFILDTDTEALYEMTGGAGAPARIGPWLNGGGAVSVDNSGNVYVSDSPYGMVYIIPAGGGATKTINGLGLPFGIAVDGPGNLYITDPLENTLKQVAPGGGLFINPALPAGLAFNSVTGSISGTPAKVSPAIDYVVSAYNLGGGVTSTFNIKVIPPNAKLTLLTLNPSTKLTKVAGSNYADYTGTIYGDAITSVKVTPTTADAGATLTVNGNPSTPGAESDPITLNADTTSIAVTVTAGDGITKNTYRIVLTRSPSNNALLTILTLNPGASLSKVSGPDYADYTATVPNSTATIKVKPITSDAGATLTVNGNPSTPGAESAPITLNADTTSIAVTVTAQDGVTKNTYRVTVTRSPSTNARLTVLTLNPGATLTKVSGPDYADYTATVSNSIGSVKVKPITSDAGATLTVNGNPSTPGAESDPITLNSDTTSIAVTVTAQDGITKNTYRVTVTRSPSNNARLTVLTLNPGATLTKVSGPDYADYTATVSNSTASVKVKPITSDAGATLTVNGNPSAPGAESSPITLNADTTSIAVTVTAPDGVTKNTYRMVLTRAPSNNARLTVLTLNPGATLTRVSGPDYADYTATVPNSTATIKVKPITSDPMATLTVNGNSSAPGAESAPITLNADTTSIAVTVTAQDGTTRNSYVIKVTRLAPPPAVMAYEQEQATPAERSEVVVHGNVSPNGDGNSDVMQIDGIGSYPDNRVQIMSRSGNLVFETKGYDNTTKVFDGHSNDGKLQQAGTYFYSLEYKVGSETKHKTGYIVLKY